MAGIQTLIEALWPVIVLVAGALGFGAWGRSKRMQGRREAEQKKVQDDVKTAEKVRDAQADSRAAGGSWHERLSRQRDDK